MKAFVLLKNPSNPDYISNLIDFTADYFPERSQGVEYKLALFRFENLLDLPETAVLAGLAKTDGYQAFDVNDLDIQARCQNLWHSEAIKIRLERPIRGSLAGEGVFLVVKSRRGRFCFLYPLGCEFEASQTVR